MLIVSNKRVSRRFNFEISYSSNHQKQTRRGDEKHLPVIVEKSGNRNAFGNYYRTTATPTKKAKATANQVWYATGTWPHTNNTLKCSTLRNGGSIAK